jgi:magnesium-transporting ATPase (P-type)
MSTAALTVATGAGLAPLAALMAGTGRGARLGILIKGPEVLESTRKVDTIVLDKTGTATTGRMTLLAAHTTTGTDETEVLRLAGALEHASEHPIALPDTLRGQGSGRGGGVDRDRCGLGRRGPSGPGGRRCREGHQRRSHHPSEGPGADADPADRRQPGRRAGGGR